MAQNKPPGWTIDARQAGCPDHADFEIAARGTYRQRLICKLSDAAGQCEPAGWAWQP